jgi:transposase
MTAISDSTRNRIAVALRAKVLKQKEIAQAYGVSVNTVQKVAAEFGLAVKRPTSADIPDNRQTKIISMYKEGWSIRHICDSLEMSRPTVQRAIKDAGIAIRYGRDSFKSRPVTH